MIGIVKATRLSARASNRLDARRIGTLTAGTVVETVGWRAGWHEIRYESRSAYVFLEFVEVHDGPPRRAGVTTTSSLSVRDRPAASGALLGTLVKRHCEALRRIC